MFERYTEKARRVIFFARYEASQFGSPYIETEHLLLGLAREDKALTSRFLKSANAAESFRQKIVEASTTRGHISTAIDLPLSDPCKRVLAYAYEESQRLAHQHIGTEHLLLGLLREPSTLANRLLTEGGLSANAVRTELSTKAHDVPFQASEFTATTGRATQAPSAIETIADELANSQSVLADRLRHLAESQGILANQLRRLAEINGTAHAVAGAVSLKQATPQIGRLLRTIRIWLSVVIIGLVLSGVTAFPLQTEAASLVRTAANLNLPAHAPALNAWLVRVASALADTNTRYPFLAYGTDWLAFAHLVIAAAFIGPWLDPVRNKWFITWGFISCAAVPLLAFIAGPVRGIPFYWRCIDSSFGLFCCLALLALRRSLAKLEALAPYCTGPI